MTIPTGITDDDASSTTLEVKGRGRGRRRDSAGDTRLTIGGPQPDGRYVGADYVEQLAKVRGGTFRRNPPDVGTLASLDSLDGPSFDSGRVDSLIRQFYEHTSRFKLSIVPEWRN